MKLPIEINQLEKMNQNNPYRAYWEKAQEKSLKLAQYYTPECLVDLCIELLQPKGELFDPCCGLGSFLLKAEAKDNDLKTLPKWGHTIYQY